MAKIVLGQKIESFPKKVVFPVVTGGHSDITVQYKYRTRTEFAEIIGDLAESAKNESVEDDADMPLVDRAKANIERTTTRIMDCVTGWDLAEEFNRANVSRLVNEFPAAANGIIDGYTIAITEGRVKN